MTSAAELYYLRHVRSCAALAYGSHGSNVCAYAPEVPNNMANCWAWLRDCCSSIALPVLTVLAQAGLLLCIPQLANLGTLQWKTAVALCTHNPVLTASTLNVFMEYDQSDEIGTWLRFGIALASGTAVLQKRHSGCTLTCRLASMSVMAALCSESILAIMLGMMAGCTEPAFPPKRVANKFGAGLPIQRRPAAKGGNPPRKQQTAQSGWGCQLKCKYLGKTFQVRVRPVHFVHLLLFVNVFLIVFLLSPNGFKETTKKHFPFLGRVK